MSPRRSIVLRNSPFSRELLALSGVICIGNQIANRREIRREDDVFAKINDVSDGGSDLPVESDPAMLDCFNSQPVPFFVAD